MVYLTEEKLLRIEKKIREGEDLYSFEAADLLSELRLALFEAELARRRSFAALNGEKAGRDGAPRTANPHRDDPQDTWAQLERLSWENGWMRGAALARCPDLFTGQTPAKSAKGGRKKVASR